jgi:hypothetical protein
MFPKQLCTLQRCHGRTTRNKTANSGKTINDTKNSIMATCTYREMSYKVHCNMLKWLAGVLHRLQFTCRPLSGMLVWLANRALLNKPFNRISHTFPIKTFLHIFQQLFIAQMATKCTIVHIRQNNRNTTTTGIWQNRAKMIVHKLAQQSTTILKLQRPSLSFFT